MGRIIRIFLCVLFLLGLALFGINSVGAKNSATNIATVLTINGSIGPATADYIHRGFVKAQQPGAGLIILQIDTPGGLSTSMRDIIKDILASSVPVVAYVAPSGARAASAGTYLLYAAQIAAMAPGTNLGAATPVAIGGGAPNADGENKKAQPHHLSEKTINDARAYMRSLAQLQKRNIKWAELAVIKGESLSATEALKMGVINVIANDISDLLQKINGMMINHHGQSYKIVTDHLVIQKIDPDWRSRFLAVITDPSIAYILLMIGFYGIIFEFMSPGLVAPGVLGSIAFLVGLYGLALLPVNYVGLALLLLGIAFMVAEAFFPSFGSLGIGGLISFIVGSIFLIKVEDEGIHLPIYVIATVVIITIVFLIFVFNIAMRSRHKPVVSGQEQLIGQQGIVTVDSDGRIWMVLEGEQWQCKSGKKLKTGQRVKVIGLEGLILQIEPIHEE